jgi:hypothetical protein
MCGLFTCAQPLFLALLSVYQRGASSLILNYSLPLLITRAFTGERRRTTTGRTRSGNHGTPQYAGSTNLVTHTHTHTHTHCDDMQLHGRTTFSTLTYPCARTDSCQSAHCSISLNLVTQARVRRVGQTCVASLRARRLTSASHSTVSYSRTGPALSGRVDQ